MEEAKYSEKHKPRRLGYGPLSAILVTVGSFFASEILAGLVLGLVPAVFGVGESALTRWLETSVVAQFLMAVLVVGAMLGLITAFLHRREVTWRAIGLVRPRGSDVWRALAGYAVYFAAFLVIAQVASALMPSLNLEQEQEILFDKSTSGNGLWLVFLSLVLLPAFAEEVIFRGFLYSGLRIKWHSITAAVVTSVLFAIAHLQVGSGNALLWVAALDTFILSMVLVYLREKTGGLAAPIIIHFIKNGLAFTFLFLVNI